MNTLARKLHLRGEAKLSLITGETVYRTGSACFAPGLCKTLVAFISTPGSMNHERAFLLLPVAFGTGIALYFQLAIEPVGWVAPLVAALALLAWRALAESDAADRGTQYNLFRIIIIGILIAATGFSIAQYRTWRIHTPLLSEQTGLLTLNGRIERVEAMRDGDTRIVLSRLHYSGDHLPPPDKRPQRVRISVKTGGDRLAPGQRIRIKAHLLAPSPPVIPGGFDFQRYIYFESIGAVGYANKKPEIIRRRDTASFQDAIISLRHGIAGRVKTQDLQHDPLITALMTGRRGGIAEADWNAMRHSGLAHMLAISGLHVGLIAGVIFFFARLAMAAFPALALRLPIKKIAAGLAIAGAFFYMLIVGGTVPTQRAFLMTGLFMLAIILDRTPISLRLVAFAAIVVLTLAPESLLGPSFQMSFAAVTGLVLFYDATREWWRGVYANSGIAGKCWLYLLGVSATSVIATAATAPFAIYHFQHTALYGVFANLLAVPIMSFLVMPMAVIGYVFMSFGGAYVPLWLMDRGIHAILQIAHGFAQLPGAYTKVPALPALALITLLAGALLAALFTGRARCWALFPAVIGLVMIAQHKPPHVIVNSDGQLVMVRNWQARKNAHGQGRLLATSQDHAYTREQWLSRLGYTPGDARVLVPGRAQSSQSLPCDRMGCRLRINGRKLALSFHPYGQLADCRWADILIARDPVDEEQCSARHIIDRFDVWEHGAHSVWLGPDSMRMATVDGTRGNRPWTGSATR